jgi:hypothetical protein
METEASDTTAHEATTVDSGLSRKRCSNVANLLRWALEALDQSDTERARSALEMAVELLTSTELRGG